mmetsp:Transcript_148182/g.259003  ORF Transcript_148182/g.259003 Transcript_148182/m.259003 type:complete len:253 (+) Transcript_148182:672-1430(+)
MGDRWDQPEPHADSRSLQAKESSFLVGPPALPCCPTPWSGLAFGLGSGLENGTPPDTRTGWCMPRRAARPLSEQGCVRGYLELQLLGHLFPPVLFQFPQHVFHLFPELLFPDPLVQGRKEMVQILVELRPHHVRQLSQRPERGHADVLLLLDDGAAEPRHHLLQDRHRLRSSVPGAQHVRDRLPRDVGVGVAGLAEPIETQGKEGGVVQPFDGHGPAQGHAGRVVLDAARQIPSAVGLRKDRLGLGGAGEWG